MVNFDNVLNYVQHDRYYTSNHTIDIKTVDKHKNRLDTRREEESVELDFGSTPINYVKNIWTCMRVYN